MFDCALKRFYRGQTRYSEHVDIIPNLLLYLYVLKHSFDLISQFFLIGFTQNIRAYDERAKFLL